MAVALFNTLRHPMRMQENKGSPGEPLPKRHGLARVMSKLGIASRTQSAAWVLDGRVRVNGRIVRDPEFPVRQGVDRVEVSGVDPAVAERMVIALNKPRGLVTSTRDEQGRDTVYSCLAGSGLPWLAPVGRLDKASEGLLLFSNDPMWASAVTAADAGPDKTYHVQVDRILDDGLLDAIARGADLDGERLSAKSVRLLRHGEKNAWLEVVLDEGRNRQIRRLLAAFDVCVLRLIRVAIGPVELGKLEKGQWRRLDAAEIDSLA